MKYQFFKYQDDGGESIKDCLSAKTSLYDSLIFHEDVVPADNISSPCKYGFVEIDDKFPDRRIADCGSLACAICSTKSLKCLTGEQMMEELTTNTSMTESGPATYVLDGIEITLIS